MKRIDSVYVLRAAILGDRNAYSRLVEEYQSQVRRFFLNLTEGDEELSKDLAQDTFIKGWVNIGSFRAAAKFSTWIYRIAYNTFYDYNRMNKHAKYFVDVSQAGNFAVSDADNKDLMMDFTKALTALNEYEKIAMVLFYMEDMAINEISKIMKSPAGTVKSHLFRGKKKLSEYLEKSGYK
ncbi:MAG: sigma-70 family RNA polymerase sigma factor [Tannerella sp.]|jgi:RNA polymerase sigma-70 factor (ECF subfamily)|nr:sigma-70 family RNA polymerase sigma factor [Tannerella sp.]